MRQCALVALSQSDDDARLLVYARLLAAAGLIRDVRFLHVRSAESDLATAESLAAIEADVVRHFGELPGVTSDCRVRTGEVLDTILEAAQEWHCDWLLVGHDSGDKQCSLAERLAMVAPCSVWLVPQGTPDRLQRVLAPVDLSDHAAESLAAALQLARTSGADTCAALHVVFDQSFDRSARNREAVRAQKQQDFRQFLARFDASAVKLRAVCEDGPHAAETILDQAQRLAADLIVMGTRGGTRAASILLGRVTSEVLSATTVPLLIVKQPCNGRSLFSLLKQNQVATESPIEG